MGGEPSRRPGRRCATKPGVLNQLGLCRQRSWDQGRGSRSAAGRGSRHTTGHFKGHPSVLLRAARIGELTRQEPAPQNPQQSQPAAPSLKPWTSRDSPRPRYESPRVTADRKASSRDPDTTLRLRDSRRAIASELSRSTASGVTSRIFPWTRSLRMFEPGVLVVGSQGPRGTAAASGACADAGCRHPPQRIAGAALTGGPVELRL
jgi:hypothetical protein